MEYRTLILADASANGSSRLDDLRELCRIYAGYFNEAIGLAVLKTKDLERLNKDALYAVADGIEYVKPLPPEEPEPLPPPGSTFVLREDGTPDWRATCAGLGDLALYGGAPMCEDGNPLLAPEPGDEALPPAVNDAILEIKRGVWETAGLFAEPAPDGWLAITTRSRKMAAWMCAAIILENVDARCDEERLYVPAAADFRLEGEVLTVVSAVAKVHAYWSASVAQQSTTYFEA
jgi:hypothetical protein